MYKYMSVQVARLSGREEAQERFRNSGVRIVPNEEVVSEEPICSTEDWDRETTSDSRGSRRDGDNNG